MKPKMGEYMYEIIRIKEGNKRFELSIPEGTHADFEIMSHVFLNALHKYDEECSKLREVNRKLHEDLRDTRGQGQSETFRQMYGTNPCSEINLKDYTDNPIEEANKIATINLAKQMDRDIMQSLRDSFNKTDDWGSGWK